MLESKPLRYFLAVAEELHFGRAAERLFIAQPPLSQQIRKLEKELGTPLFVRTSRKVALTQAGEFLLDEARRILSDLQQAEEMVRAMTRGEAGRIRMGFVGPAMHTDLAFSIRSFRQEHPGIRLVLEESTTVEQLEKVGSGALDIGHVRLFRHETSGFVVRLISREDYVLALPPDHVLVRKNRVSPAELDGQPFVSFPKSQQPALHDAIFNALAAAGAVVDVVQEARRKETILALVAAESGVAIVPSSARRSGRTDVVFREFSDAKLPAVEIFQIWRADQVSATLKRFLEHTQGLMRT